MESQLMLRIDNIGTLVDLCLAYFAKNFNNIDLTTLNTLPKNLLGILFKRICKRGLLSDENIDLFLNNQLKILELSDCLKISDAALKKLSICKYMHKIDLNSHTLPRTLITSLGISQLAKSCKFLQFVFLRRCVNVNDSCVDAIAVNCTNLKYLNIGNCPLVTDKALESLGKNCKNLKSIDLSGTNITDNGIFSFITTNVAKNIKEVHIANCKIITDESIECILMNSPKIEYLLFHNCPKTTSASRIALEEYMTKSTNQKVKHLTWTIY